jgi:hypothetical protein
VADVIYVLVIIAFFALTALFVVACDRIIGSEAQSGGAVSPDSDDGLTGSSSAARSRMDVAA